MFGEHIILASVGLLVGNLQVLQTTTITINRGDQVVNIADLYYYKDALSY